MRYCTNLKKEKQATQLINNHIFTNQTYLINSILQINQIISWTDICNLFDQDDNPQEIYEWWLISPWLAKRLREAGEPILKTDFGYWWGRTVTGQAIKFDYVIQSITSN